MANEFVIRRGLISLGGVTYPLTEVNNSYTVLTTDYYVSVDAGSTQRTLTLPTDGNVGQGFILKNDYNSTANVITAGANIDGDASIDIRPGETYQIVWTGTEYLLAGINGTSGSSGSSGTSGSSGSSGTSGSSGSSGTSGEGICNNYKVQTAGTPNANGEILFNGSVTNASVIQIFDTNSDGVDWTEYYEMIAGRNLSGTLTATEINDTDSYIVYEFDTEGVSFAGNVLSITPTAVYASPLVDTTNAPVENVCIQFDLFRGVKTLQETNVVNTTVTLYTFTQSEYDGAVVDYVVKRTDSTGGTRTGSIYIAWNGSTVANTDQSTRDVGLATSGLTFVTLSNGTNTELRATASAGNGTFTITISVRPIGTYM